MTLIEAVGLITVSGANEKAVAPRTMAFGLVTCPASRQSVQARREAGVVLVIRTGTTRPPRRIASELGSQTVVAEALPGDISSCMSRGHDSAN